MNETEVFDLQITSIESQAVKCPSFFIFDTIVSSNEYDCDLVRSIRSLPIKFSRAVTAFSITKIINLGNLLLFSK